MKEATANFNLVLVAALALVDVDGRVLLAKRPPGKHMADFWEFPGGKMERFEAPEDTVIREAWEELGIDIEKSCLAPLAFTSYPYDEFHLLMTLFICRIWKGIAGAREHQALAWVTPEQMNEYPMPPADIPLVASLRDLL